MKNHEKVLRRLWTCSVLCVAWAICAPAGGFDLAWGEKSADGSVIRVADAKSEAANQFFTEAWALFQGGQHQAARLRFESGLELDPGNARGHYYLAETLMVLGEPDPARRHYEFAKRLGPDTKEGIMAATVLNGWERRLQEAKTTATRRRGQIDSYKCETCPLELTLSGLDCRALLTRGKYDGELLAGQPDGRGRMQFVVETVDPKRSPASYDGEWRNGMINGFGVLLRRNGNRYEGEFLNCKYHGQGKLTVGKSFWTDENSSLEGSWVDGNLEGHAVWTFLNSRDRWVGPFTKGSCDGGGTYYFSDGRTQRVECRSGVFRKDGQMFKGRN